MVMWFNVKEARECLLTKGHVFTLRPKKRREGHEALMYDGFGKKGDLQVAYWGQIHVEDVNTMKALNAIVDESGFASVDDWLKAAGDSRFLYRVELRNNPIKEQKGEK